MSTLEIWTAGDPQVLAAIFNGIAMLGSGGDFAMFFKVAALVALAVGIGTIIMVRFNQAVSPYDLVHGAFTTPVGLFILYSVLFLPTTTVTINGLYSYSTETVADVPIGIAYPASYASRIGQELTQVIDQAFSAAVPGCPSPLQRRIDYCVSLAQLLTNPLPHGIRSTEAATTTFLAASTNLYNIWNTCTSWDIGMGLLDQQQILQSTDLSTTLIPSTLAYGSGKRSFDYYDQDGVLVTPSTCTDGYTATLTMLNGPITDDELKLDYNDLFGQDGTGNLLDTTDLETAAGVYLKTVGDARDQIRQRLMATQLRDAIATMQGAGGDNSTAVLETAVVTASKENSLSALQTTGQLAAQFIPALQGNLEGIIYAVFPFIPVVLIIPSGTWKLFGEFVIHLLFVQLLMPLYLLVQMMIVMYAQRKMGTPLATVGNESVISLPLGNFLHMDNMIDIYQSMAWNLMAIVPVLAYALVRGGANFAQQAIGDSMKHASIGGSQLSAERAGTKDYLKGVEESLSMGSGSRPSISGTNLMWYQDQYPSLGSNRRDTYKDGGHGYEGAPVSGLPAQRALSYQQAYHNEQSLTRLKSQAASSQQALDELDGFRTNAIQNQQGGTTYQSATTKLEQDLYQEAQNLVDQQTYDNIRRKGHEHGFTGVHQAMFTAGAARFLTESGGAGGHAGFNFGVGSGGRGGAGSGMGFGVGAHVEGEISKGFTGERRSGDIHSRQQLDQDLDAFAASLQKQLGIGTHQTHSNTTSGTSSLQKHFDAATSDLISKTGDHADQIAKQESTRIMHEFAQQVRDTSQLMYSSGESFDPLVDRIQRGEVTPQDVKALLDRERHRAEGMPFDQKLNVPRAEEIDNALLEQQARIAGERRRLLTNNDGHFAITRGKVDRATNDAQQRQNVPVLEGKPRQAFETATQTRNPEASFTHAAAVFDGQTRDAEILPPTVTPDRTPPSVQRVASEAGQAVPRAYTEEGADAIRNFLNPNAPPTAHHDNIGPGAPAFNAVDGPSGPQPRNQPPSRTTPSPNPAAAPTSPQPTTSSVSSQAPEPSPFSSLPEEPFAEANRELEKLVKDLQ